MSDPSHEATSPVVETRDLVRVFGAQRAVDGLSFDVRRGECLGLLGPNGAGKTTTIRILSTQCAPTSGSARVLGLDPTRDGAAIRARIGVVPQEIALYGSLTARENLEFFGRLYDLEGERLAERVAWALGVAGLAERADDRVEVYSGGMKRRLNLVAALLHEPELVFLDEPTVGIDPQSRNHVFEMVEALKRGGTSLVYTTHQLGEVERLADRIVILDRGRPIAQGTLAELAGAGGQGAQEPDPPRRRREGRRGDRAALRARDRLHGRGGRAPARGDLPGLDRARPEGRGLMLATAWILARKDLKLYFRDRTALLLSLLLPVFLATIFAAAMGSFGSDEGIGRVNLLVEDQDQSEASRALVAELGESEGLRVEAATEVRSKVARGRAPAALLVPAGWGAKKDTEEPQRLVLYRDPGQEIEQQIVAGNLLPALFKANGEAQGKAMMKRSLSMLGFPKEWAADAEGILDGTWDSIRELAEDSPIAEGAGGAEERTGPEFSFAEAVPELLGVDTEDVAGGADPSRKFAGQAHAISGIAVMMLLFGLVGCGGTLLEEQTEGTLGRLRLMPAPGASILLGKFLFTAVAGLLQLVILFSYGALLFDVPVLRAPVALVVLSLALLSAATGLGLFLAVACRTRKQLEGLSTLVILVMSALGGSWFPLIITPEWYRKLGHFTLNAWAMDGFQGIFWYGKDLAGIRVEILVLFAIAAAMSLLAVRGWKRRFEVA